MLKDIIRRLGLIGDAQQVLASLNEVIVSDNTKAWTSGDLPDALGGYTNAITLLSSLELSTNPIMRSAFIALSTRDGLTLYQPSRQAMVDLLNLGPDLTAKVKGLGKFTKTRFETEGGVGNPTLSDVTSCLNSITLEDWAIALKQRVEASINIALDQPNATIQSIKAAAIAEIG